MKCPFCGHEIENEKAHFCPKCGHKLSGIINPKKVSFKDGIKNLFKKLFLFEGKDTRKLFNFGVLFLVLINIGINIICSIFFTTDFIAILNNSTNADEAMNLLNEIVSSESFRELSMIVSILSSSMLLIFLCAPLYRRHLDSGSNKKVAIGYLILFVLGQLIDILAFFIPASSVILSVIINIISIGGMVSLLSAMIKPSSEVRLYEDVDNS